MPDRADYLAKTLLIRMRSLEGVMHEDTAATEPGKARRRTELVEKILAIEAGVTDGVTIKTVEAALPTIAPERATSPREQSEFAAFLRRRLPSDA